MKTMRMTTKAKAHGLIGQLYEDNEDPRVIIEKYDRGKYQWLGRAAMYEGTIVEVCNVEIFAIWAERRVDSNGWTYAQLMCASV